MLTLRDYQIFLSKKAFEILKVYNIVYLAFSPRVGKTATAFEVCKLANAKRVLFVTKKKAIKGIETDYKDFGYTFALTVINYEQLHNIKSLADIVVFDEAHSLGAFPKPTSRTKEAKKVAGNAKVIFLSGTPSPENFSQLYHQFWVSNYSPFTQYPTFYKWAKVFVNVTQKRLGHGVVNDYTDAKIELIRPLIDPITISFTQEQAGFEATIDENIIEVEMKESTYNLINRLKKDLVVEGKEETILADTAVKLQSKLHQLYSGTIKFESGKTQVLDYSKVVAILKRFEGVKIVIFYKFIAELEAIKKIYSNQVTTDLEEFNTTDKSIALQIISGREGLNLSKAKYIVFYNIDFSNLSYWQARDRLTTIDRKENNIFWVFSKGGIEHYIYKSVMRKKNYVLSHFKRDFKIK